MDSDVSSPPTSRSRHCSLGADLAAYAEYYREGRGEPIARWALGVQMLQTFTGSDRAFLAWRRQHRSVATGRVDVFQSDGQGEQLAAWARFCDGKIKAGAGRPLSARVY